MLLARKYSRTLILRQLKTHSVDLLTLICHVKEDIKFAVFTQLRQFFPLFLGRIHTGRVVGTSVQQYHAVFRNFGNVFTSCGEIQATSFRIVIPITIYIDTSMFKDWCMISPRWLGKVNGFV